MAAVVVFGGNGFVGSHILKALVALGVPAVSVSRKGIVPKHLENEAWAQKVHWAKGDALEPKTYEALLRGSGSSSSSSSTSSPLPPPPARAVVLCVGSPPVPFVDEAWQTKMNGATNCAVIGAAAAEGGPEGYEGRVFLSICVGARRAADGVRAGGGTMSEGPGVV